MTRIEWMTKSVPLESPMHDSAIDARRPTLLGELLSFGLVGGFAALGFVGLSMFMVGIETGLPDWVVSACCYAVFIVPVYLAHRHFSFRSDAPHNVALPRYVTVQMSAMVLAALFSFVCYRVLNLSSGVAAPLIIGLTSGVNFAILRLWAFAVRR